MQAIIMPIATMKYARTGSMIRKIAMIRTSRRKTIIILHDHYGV